MDCLGPQNLFPKLKKFVNTFGLIIYNRGNNSLGRAKAGVPVNNIICFFYDKKGTKHYITIKKKINKVY